MRDEFLIEIFAYPGDDALLRAESHGGAKSPLPGSRGAVVPERPATLA